jgi:hypothetical protein
VLAEFRKRLLQRSSIIDARSSSKDLWPAEQVSTATAAHQAGAAIKIGFTNGPSANVYSSIAKSSFCYTRV